MKKVDLLMVTYNRLEYTKFCFDHLIKNTKYPFHLTIVDNSSSDGTVDWLKSIRNNYTQIREIIFNEGNLGLTRVTNDFWRKSNADYIGKIDNDILVPPGWLSRLVEAHNVWKKLGIVACWHFWVRETHTMKLNPDRIHRFNNKISIAYLYPYLGGLAYLMKKGIVHDFGFIEETRDLKYSKWPHYVERVSLSGKYLTGYLYPLIYVENMDNLSHPMCLIGKNDNYLAHTKQMWTNERFEAMEKAFGKREGESLLNRLNSFFKFEDKRLKRDHFIRVIPSAKFSRVVRKTVKSINQAFRSFHRRKKRIPKVPEIFNHK